MAGRLTEEQLTKYIIGWLEANRWEIICFDFPQSGTGIMLHPNQTARLTKNKGAIIPDIVAQRDSVGVLFENKDHFSLSDVRKIQDLKNTDDYSESLQRLFSSNQPNLVFYGIGLPDTPSDMTKMSRYWDSVDFVTSVTVEGDVIPKSIAHGVSFI